MVKIVITLVYSSESTSYDQLVTVLTAPSDTSQDENQTAEKEEAESTDLPSSSESDSQSTDSFSSIGMKYFAELVKR